MKCSYRIINGRVVDPAAGVDEVRDVCVGNGKMIAVEPGAEAEAAEVIDARGCIVAPGLIDFHTHLDWLHSDVGLHPDLMTLPNCITAAVDAGTDGSANFEGFYKNVACAADITVKSFLNVAAAGIITEMHTEMADPDLWDRPRMEYLFGRYGADLLGLKVRLGKIFSREFGLKPLEETKKLAARLGTAVCVHAVHPESPFDDILSLMDAGDILCHCYQGKGDYSLIDGSGKVIRAAREARERGVIFDSASGRANYSFAIARQALADGFLPDVITTDVVTYSIYKPKVFSLTHVMSYYLALGLSLGEVLQRVTAAPARLMKLEGSIGTLAPGAFADIAIFKLEERPILFQDQFGNSVQGTRLIIPKMTIKAGRTAYMSADFAFPAS